MPETQTLAASLVAPSRPSLLLGYRVLTLAGNNYSTLITTGVSEDTPPSGIYRVNGGVIAPIAGGFLQWWRISGSVAIELIAAISIPPGPALSGGSDFETLKSAVWTRQPRYGWPEGPIPGY